MFENCYPMLDAGEVFYVFKKGFKKGWKDVARVFIIKTNSLKSFYKVGN
ncbi:MAG: hypothetical protein CM15mP62_29310 [Rhodospirillaceae bacterium]|nr:MAG: hypothetical protein CM15mP62_29310 [Rhodospirillaceae bacterium]